MRKKALLLGLLSLIMAGLFSSCTEDENGDIQVFEGVHLINDNGSPIGCYGPCEDDWKESELSTEELTHILLIPDNIVVAPPVGAYSFDKVGPFPIPIRDDGKMYIAIGCNQEAKFKMAVVSREGNRLAFISIKVDEPHQLIALDNVFFNLVPRGEIVRMYYGYFDHQNTPLYTGYGDIAVCRSTYDGTNIDDCFN